MENEEWRPVVGYELTYEVSSLGRVRSLDKMVNQPGGGKRLKKGQIVKGCFSYAKYLQVNLWDAQHHRTQKIHRLVAKSFIPNPHGYEHVNHKDFNRTNNRADNLEWCTPLQNTTHMVEAGRMAKGEEKPLAKLTNEDIIEIRKIHADAKIKVRVPRGFLVDLAKRFGVSESAISQVVSKASWKHI